MSATHQPAERQEPPRTHFDRALEATRKGYLAARDVAAALENAGICMRHPLVTTAENSTALCLKRVRERLQDLRLLVDDVEAHLRLSDAAEEHATSKKKKIVLDSPGAPV